VHHTYYPEFLTATILKWQRLLQDDNCKTIILDSLQWLVNEKRCKVYAFVIMPNHIHLLWRIEDGYERDKVQGALLSYTAHEFKNYLKRTNRLLLQNYFVDDADRTYQFWERNSKVKEGRSHPFFIQKLEYMHYNPCQPHWNLATVPEEYPWSSVAFYETNSNSYPWLTHVRRVSHVG
jgi:REP element-mobilizing transposase RayT